MSISSPLATLYQVLKNVAASAEAEASILQKNEVATPLLMAALLAGVSTAGAQTAPLPSLSGNWSGSLGPIEFTMHLADPAAGPRTATLDIPAQQVQGMAMRFTAPADSVCLSIAQPAARFAGRRSADGRQLAGEWQQGLRVFPLTLGRTGATGQPAPRRQTPQPPFPYQSANVTLKNKKDNVKLAGTYSVPADMGPAALTVIGDWLTQHTKK
ncbi:hypothetical protein [Hymenobacter glacialis]|uniref:Uncharacterized protein n=1 Tax=Hymenobacter glacialis TaxID=1908236 RepID=A0A1G1T9K4_9BACT|nr:hypothetical protein [Hymenobacter glacialis]OGX87548.1 hypothetical protein BEN48_11205 [Hymenobacter glacialis]